MDTLENFNNNINNDNIKNKKLKNVIKWIFRLRVVKRQLSWK
jgi:hypothetical protein